MIFSPDGGPISPPRSQLQPHRRGPGRWRRIPARASAAPAAPAAPACGPPGPDRHACGAPQARSRPIFTGPGASPAKTPRRTAVLAVSFEVGRWTWGGGQERGGPRGSRADAWLGEGPIFVARRRRAWPGAAAGVDPPHHRRGGGGGGGGGEALPCLGLRRAAFPLRGPPRGALPCVRAQRPPRTQPAPPRPLPTPPRASRSCARP